MRFPSSLAPVAAILAVTMPQLAGAAVYRLQPLTAVASMGAFQPVTISETGQAAGTLFPQAGGSIALFTDGTSVTTADYCGSNGAVDATYVAATSPYSTDRFIAGNCGADGFLHDMTTGVTTPVVYPNSDVTGVTAVSGSGTVAGYINIQAGGDQGFYGRNGKFHIYTEGAFTFASGINVHGTIFGTANSGVGPSYGYLLSHHATLATVRWPDAAYASPILGLNAAGQAAGYAQNSANHAPPQAFEWQNGNFLTPDLPANAAGSVASAINERGVVAGTYTDTAGFAHGFVWQLATGAMLYFDPPSPVNQMEVTAINNRRAQVTGYYVDSNGQQVGFLASCKGKGCF